MRRILFAIPGDLGARTGGYEYDRRILQAVPALGVDIVHLAMLGSFPEPSAQDVADAVESLDRAVEPGDVVLMDGLACGALPESALRRVRMPLIELCHHPLCLEAGLAPARAATLREIETRSLALVAHILVTSPHTAGTLVEDFSAPPAKISVALPGTDPAARARGLGTPLTLLAVGSIIPRKGFDILVEALAGLDDLDWRLNIVGSHEHAPATTLALRERVASLGLAPRVEFAGERSSNALSDLYVGADIFVSSSHYEGYGMALAEALARGLPIVMTKGGAAGETVPDAAALKVPPGDIPALRSALRLAMTDRGLRLRLSDEAWRAGQQLPRWEDAARIVVEAARRVGAPAI